jgi:2-polyprenyl-6-methoxyphenol hydroxylase-like FAD-dependent oxidoreductase
MANASGIYFDRVSQIRMDRWTTGRTALVGDAAACVSLLAGEGTGLALAAAYVLAGELRGCGGDYVAAYAGYQERMMPFLKRKQESAANLVTVLLRLPIVADFFIGPDLRDDIKLPDYGF